jgi:Family of unknown function (DUF6445)
MADPLALAQETCARTEYLGNEAQPLVVFDQFLADPGAVLDIAARAPFAPIGPHYPGVRSPVPAAALATMIAALQVRLVADFGLSSPPHFHECYLSLVTLGAADLQPIQRLPHFDGVERDSLALLLYLDRAETGGTAFYRHRSTGFESVDAGRLDRFTLALAQDAALHGVPQEDYIRSDTPIYERTAAIAGRFNRAVVYRGNTLHCADLPAGFNPSSDPQSGRLTLNLFLRCNP